MARDNTIPRGGPGDLLDAVRPVNGHPGATWVAYYRRGGILYGTVYTLWRSWCHAQDLAWTWLCHKTIGRCGRGTTFKRDTYIGVPRRVIVGEDSHFGEHIVMQSESDGGFLEVDAKVQVSDRCWLDYTGGIWLRRGCVLSSGVRIWTHDHGYDPRSKPVARSLTVGEGAWIGFEAVVLPGVDHIGKNAVVGARAVVTKPVARNTIVAGNPARVVGIRPAQGASAE